VGLLLAAKEEGLVSAIKPLLENLQEAGMYLGDTLIQQALHLAGEP
jgi:predicted nucleic acid-binding protein